MLSRPAENVIHDILENINYIEDFISNMTLDDFQNNIMVQYAVSRAIINIGEATKQLPFELVDQYSTFNWGEVRNTCVYYVHSYNTISPKQIWNEAQFRCTHLKAVLEKIKLKL